MCQNSTGGVHRDQKLQCLNVFPANFLSRKNDSGKETEARLKRDLKKEKK